MGNPRHLQTWWPKSGVGVATVNPHPQTRIRSVATVAALGLTALVQGLPALWGITPWPTSMAIVLLRKHSINPPSIVTFVPSCYGVSWVKDTFAKVSLKVKIRNRWKYFRYSFLEITFTCWQLFHVRKLLSFSFCTSFLHFFSFAKQQEICCALFVVVVLQLENFSSFSFVWTKEEGL